MRRVATSEVTIDPVASCVPLLNSVHTLLVPAYTPFASTTWPVTFSPFGLMELIRNELLLTLKPRCVGPAVSSS